MTQSWNPFLFDMHSSYTVYLHLTIKASFSFPHQQWAVQAGLRYCVWAWRTPVHFRACGRPQPQPARWCGWRLWHRTLGRKLRWKQPALRMRRPVGRGVTQYPAESLKLPTAAPGGNREKGDRLRISCCTYSGLHTHMHFSCRLLYRNSSTFRGKFLFPVMIHMWSNSKYEAATSSWLG